MEQRESVLLVSVVSALAEQVQIIYESEAKGTKQACGCMVVKDISLFYHYSPYK